MLSRDNLPFPHPVKSNIITLNMIHRFREPNSPRLTEIKAPIKSRVSTSINHPPRQQLLPQKQKICTYVTVAIKSQQVLSSAFSLNPFSLVHCHVEWLSEGWYICQMQLWHVTFATSTHPTYLHAPLPIPHLFNPQAHSFKTGMLSNAMPDHLPT